MKAHGQDKSTTKKETIVPGEKLVLDFVLFDENCAFQEFTKLQFFFEKIK